MEYLGYKYSKTIKNKAGTTYYRCTEKVKSLCKGSVKKTEYGHIYIIRHHNHPMNAMDFQGNWEANPEQFQMHQSQQSLNEMESMQQVETCQERQENSNDIKSDINPSIKVSIPLVSLQFDMPLDNLASNLEPNLVPKSEPSLTSSSILRMALSSKPKPCPIIKEEEDQESVMKFSIKQILSDKIPRSSEIQERPTVIHVNTEYHPSNRDVYIQDPNHGIQIQGQENNEPLDLSMKPVSANTTSLGSN